MSDTESTIAVVDRFYSTLKKNHSEDFLAIMDDDIQLHLSGNSPISGHVNGKTMLVEQVFPHLMGQLDFDNFSFCTRWKVMCAADNRATAIMEAKGSTLSGKPYDQRYCHIFEVNQGKIVTLWEFFDCELVRDSLFDGKQLPSPFTEFEF